MKPDKLPCPFCHEPISPHAKVCKHCDREVLFRLTLMGKLTDRQKHDFIKTWASLEQPRSNSLCVKNYSDAKAVLDQTPVELAWELTRDQSQRLMEALDDFPVDSGVQGGVGRPDIVHVEKATRSNSWVYAAGLFIALSVLGYFTYEGHQPELAPSSSHSPLALEVDVVAKPKRKAFNQMPTQAPELALPSNENKLNRGSIAQLLDSTVFIRDDRRLGTGFFITSNGYLLSNAHVTSAMAEPIVILRDGREFKAEKIKENTHLDVSLLKIDVGGLPYLRMGDANELYPGQPILTIGNPSGLSFTVTRGVVSYLGRNIRNIQFIQTDAAINKGNSGGPMITEDLKVVGINSLTSLRDEGISFALPINYAYDGQGIASGIGDFPEGAPSFEGQKEPVSISKPSAQSSPQEPRQLARDHYQSEARDLKAKLDRDINRMTKEQAELKSELKRLDDYRDHNRSDLAGLRRSQKRSEEIDKEYNQLTTKQNEAKLRYVRQMISLLQRQRGDVDFERFWPKIDQQIQSLRASKTKLEASLN